MRSSVLVAAVVTTAALSTAAGATPWGDRCKARLAKAIPTLRSIGPAKISIDPAPPQKSGTIAALDSFGRLRFVIVAGDHTFTASIGSDPPRHRYRGYRGIVETRYEEWHSPYVDSLNGDPPDRSEQPMLEEFHHHVSVGVIRAELRIDVAVPKGQPAGLRAPPSTGRDQRFADTLRPILAACWADVTPDEADPSLAWTSTCLADLSRAHAALVKREPIFRNGACVRKPFDASCGHVEGAPPTWNALMTLAGGPKAARVWTADGVRRRSYADGGALIWASAQLTPAQFRALSSAFEKPLERCWQRLRANMFVP